MLFLSSVPHRQIKHFWAFKPWASSLCPRGASWIPLESPRQLLDTVPTCMVQRKLREGSDYPEVTLLGCDPKVLLVNCLWRSAILDPRRGRYHSGENGACLGGLSGMAPMLATSLLTANFSRSPLAGRVLEPSPLAAGASTPALHPSPPALGRLSLSVSVSLSLTPPAGHTA